MAPPDRLDQAIVEYAKLKDPKAASYRELREVVLKLVAEQPDLTSLADETVKRRREQLARVHRALARVLPLARGLSPGARYALWSEGTSGVAYGDDFVMRWLDPLAHALTRTLDTLGARRQTNPPLLARRLILRDLRTAFDAAYAGPRTPKKSHRLNFIRDVCRHTLHLPLPKSDESLLKLLSIPRTARRSD